MTRHTNVARKHEEIIVSETAVVLGVEQSLNIDAVTLGVVFQHIESRVEVENLLLVQDGDLLHAFAVLNGHDVIKW